ncbi:hypothetical protein H310_12012 [Aphanomyces invadans]|uniref:Uncharacterized protein n=1 Tax=Aphanomyces invadans TaxID=157072 RepID=A0A024TK52_9STRA|nr:hypothetical protein H310_12012 [Aphanomyces invadans]ETV94374.1 hypothetical protein H310_12012 [Aphanomyces invadans]|eukprot:XP_008877136.1 hypothetical protein H310_12012 [Aphanomyces invadans]
MAATSGDTHDMADMMKVYTEGMQAQFGAMLDKFRTSMEQSVGMSRMMNDMMEHLLLQSLHVRCEIKQSSGTCAPMLHLDVKNSGAIPIPVVCCAISIRRRFPEVSSDANDDPVLDFKTSPEDVDVGAHASAVIPLNLPTIDQYNGQIIVSCVSPGSGQRLQKTNDFSVYLVQQWSISPSFESVVDVPSSTKSALLDVARLRDVLQLSPADGIVLESQGHYVVLATSSPAFVLTVALVDSTTCHVQVSVAAAPQPSRWTPRDVVLELEALAHA